MASDLKMQGNSAAAPAAQPIQSPQFDPAIVKNKELQEKMRNVLAPLLDQAKVKARELEEKLHKLLNTCSMEDAPAVKLVEQEFRDVLLLQTAYCKAFEVATKADVSIQQLLEAQASLLAAKEKVIAKKSISELAQVALKAAEKK